MATGWCSTSTTPTTRPVPTTPGGPARWPRPRTTCGPRSRPASRPTPTRADPVRLLQLPGELAGARLAGVGVPRVVHAPAEPVEVVDVGREEGADADREEDPDQQRDGAGDQPGDGVVAVVGGALVDAHDAEDAEQHRQQAEEGAQRGEQEQDDQHQ